MSLNLNFGTKHPLLISGAFELRTLQVNVRSQCLIGVGCWSNDALLGSLYPETMLSLKVFPSKCPLSPQPGRKETQPHWMTMNNTMWGPQT